MSDVTTFTIVSGKIRTWTFTGDLIERELADQFVLFPSAGNTYVPQVGDIVVAARPQNWRKQYGRFHRWHPYHRNPRNAESFLSLHNEEIVTITITQIDTVSSRVVYANRFNYGRLIQAVVSPADLSKYLTDVQIDGYTIVTNQIGEINASTDANDATFPS